LHAGFSCAGSAAPPRHIAYTSVDVSLAELEQERTIPPAQVGVAQVLQLVAPTALEYVLLVQVVHRAEVRPAIHVYNDGRVCIASISPLFALPGGHPTHAAAAPRVNSSWPLGQLNGLHRIDLDEDWEG